jgi:hypothetical protein
MDAAKSAQTKLIIIIVLTLVFVCCFVSCLFSVAFIIANNMIGGLGNPYLFWP